MSEMSYDVIASIGTKAINYGKFLGKSEKGDGLWQVYCFEGKIIACLFDGEMELINSKGLDTDELIKYIS